MEEQVITLTHEEAVAIAEQQKQQIARDHCAARIRTFYPEWKQLNIIASGDAEEISKMRAFITTCRDWSNAESHDFQVLYGLKP